MRHALVLACLLPLVACQEAPPPQPDPASERATAAGPVVGFDGDGVFVWRGIPFAAPTGGDARWRPPAPPEPWEELREATTFGAPCPQLGPSGDAVGDEDCLFLNVFAPRGAAEAPPDRGLPVMVFIHGGGNSVGSAEVYDGARLARENRVVVVTVHYRLGVFGWLSHPALRAEATTPEEASGNWGTLDLVAALEWVRRNAAAFGGDPERVTIFGESAGAIDVYSLLLAPAAEGLFHRAIAQSGFATAFTRAQAEHRRDAPDPGEAASSAEVLLALLQREGDLDRAASIAAADAMSEAEIAGYLRSRTPAELLAPFQEAGTAMGGMYVAPFVIRDGAVIPDEDPLERFARGDYHQVPIVVGTNRDEQKLFQAFNSPHVRRVLGVPVGFHDAERYDRVAEYGSKLWKAAGADEPAAAMRGSQGPSVWAYRFDWDELSEPLWLPLPRLLGAAHAMELFFVFGATDSDFAGYVMEDVASADRLSRQMRGYWAALAADGAPGRGQQGDLPLWAPWGAGEAEPRFLIFDSEEDGGLRMSGESLTRAGVVARVGSDPRIESTDERCEIYRGFVQWSDAMSPEEYAALPACKDHPLLSRTAFDPPAR